MRCPTQKGTEGVLAQDAQSVVVGLLPEEVGVANHVARNVGEPLHDRFLQLGEGVVQDRVDDDRGEHAVGFRELHVGLCPVELVRDLLLRVRDR